MASLGWAASQLCSRRLHRSRRVRDLAMLAHFSPFSELGKSNRDRILVNIEAGVGDKPSHVPTVCYTVIAINSGRSPTHPKQLPGGARTAALDPERVCGLLSNNQWPACAEE
jgi:hypothetical protein